MILIRYSHDDDDDDDDVNIHHHIFIEIIKMNQSIIKEIRIIMNK